MVLLGKNRDSLSIVAAILEKYLEMAVNVGLVSICGSSYRLTEQGRDFLKR